MIFYAQLNENKICIGLSMLNNIVENPNMIEIPNMDDGYMWKKYEEGKWSVEKYEPESTAPLTEFETLKQQMGSVIFEDAMNKSKISDLEIQNGNLMLEIAMLKTGGVL